MFLRSACRYIVICGLVTGGAAQAQRRLEAHQMYERIIAVVPMIGTGTGLDPRRPMFVPVSSVSADAPAAVESGQAAVDKSVDDKGESPKDLRILAYRVIESDDGKTAIVEFVARDRAAFAAIEKSGRADVLTFRRNTTPKAELETELRKVKKTFKVEDLGVAAQ